jgi:Fe-S-cluster containining protein
MTPDEYNARTDSIVAKIHAQPGALKPCCQKGCHHCCYEAAYADRRQIDHIIAGMTPEQIEEVKAKLPEWLEKTKDMRARSRQKSAIPYRELNVPCPLLKNGLCSVYDRRPLDCRIFFAIGNPDDCAMPARKHQKFAEYPTHVMGYLCGPWAKDTLETEGEIVMDHIGVLLAERLLGLSVPSAGRLEVEL